jgi:hypothetical protein
MANIRDALGNEAESEARVAGRALPLEAAVSEALALADKVVNDADGVGLLDSVRGSVLGKESAGAQERDRLR